MDFQQVIAAQRSALAMDNGQPTAIVYRTIKGWQYGIEGKASHGAGHKLCSDGFYEAVAPLLQKVGGATPQLRGQQTRCDNGQVEEVVEECFWEALGVVRKSLEQSGPVVSMLAQAPGRCPGSASAGSAGRPGKERPGSRRSTRRRRPRSADGAGELAPKPGSVTTLRGELGNVLNHYNKASGGSFLAARRTCWDPRASTSSPPGSRRGSTTPARDPARALLSIGGICEDAMCGILAGLSTYGRHIGARLVLRRLHRAAGPHRRAPARHRLPGAAGHREGAVPPLHPDLRPRRTEDRRGRPDPRRSPAAAAPAGELPAGHR